MGIDIEKHQVLFLQVLRDYFSTYRHYSDQQLIKKIGKERVTDACLEFFGYMEGGSSALSQNEQLALAQKLLKCLARYIESTNTPVTLKTMIDNIILLEHAVDKCYPGYAASKLLRHVITHRAA